MIAAAIIFASCLIILIGFILVTWAYDRGLQDGYDAGHDDGFAHGRGQHLPPMQTQDCKTQDAR